MGCVSRSREAGRGDTCLLAGQYRNNPRAKRDAALTSRKVELPRPPAAAAVPVAGPLAAAAAAFASAAAAAFAAAAAMQQRGLSGDRQAAAAARRGGHPTDAGSTGRQTLNKPQTLNPKP